MAKDILYIADGAAVNAAWTGHIVISGDGTNWDAINIVGLSATAHPVSFNTSAPNSYPERNKESGWVIVLKRSNSEGAVLKFNPEKVTNQATWSTTGTAADINAGKQAALADILTWLA